MDRAYRLGQTRNVEVYRLVAQGTIEELCYMRQVCIDNAYHWEMHTFIHTWRQACVLMPDVHCRCMRTCRRDRRADRLSSSYTYERADWLPFFASDTPQIYKQQLSDLALDGVTTTGTCSPSKKKTGRKKKAATEGIRFDSVQGHKGEEGELFGVENLLQVRIPLKCLRRLGFHSVALN